MNQLDIFRLDGRVALIGGGGGAIGGAIAEAFAGAGAQVVVAGRHQDKLDATVERIRTAGSEGVAVAGRHHETCDAAVERIRAAGSEGLAISADATSEIDCDRMVRETIAREPPDALVHLAFVLNPIHDEHAMDDIDVGGTQNVLEAAEELGVGQVLVTSSTTAYGAFSDNPVPIHEHQPVRGVPDFEYARDKAECDRLCQLWALRNPERVMTIVRPCIVMGPNVDNYIVRLWTNQPFQADLGLPAIPFQFVHEDDVVEAIVRLLDGRHGGAFNVTGDGTVPGDELAELIGMPRRRIPLKLYWQLAGLMWRLRRSETPPGNIHFAIHPWVASNEKLKETLGWQPQHTSLEAFEAAMRARGKLPASAA
jgi:UDP-glucose 4-epimerase